MVRPAPAAKPAVASAPKPPAKPVPKPVVSPKAAAAVSEAKPVAAKPEPAPAPVAKPVEPAPVAKVVAPAPAARAVPPQPASLDSLPLPRPPEAAAVATATVMSQALTMARAYGALQARMLDHACAELEATLTDAQTLARSKSASEAIALQARAVRRSYESYAEHLKELARAANAALHKG
jgi:outer membrane biosynthesis protein TonB